MSLGSGAEGAGTRDMENSEAKCEIIQASLSFQH